MFQYQTIIVFYVLLFVGCKSTGTSTHNYSSSRMIVINKEVLYAEETIFDKEVTIYPEAFLKTSGRGKIIFTKKVNIIGESQVFDENINVVFGFATLNTLNPTWFGAKGYDEIDDTPALTKVFELASLYAGTITIDIPIGRFIVTRTLNMGSQTPDGETINLTGKGMSANSRSGSSFIWKGAEGASMITMRNNANGVIDGLGFNSIKKHGMKYDIELRPFINFLSIRNCSFTGCTGEGSANINLNKGSNEQVSEINIENCLFGGVTYDNQQWLTEAAVCGGSANAKNFYFRNCSFLGYSIAGINIHITDILKVENCTFGFNDIDINCDLCNTIATSNYSEHSKSFFKSIISQNVAFTTLIGNNFYGSEGADYVIRGGAGSLVMINNNFGGLGVEDNQNKIMWDDKIISSIYSVGNFYRNSKGIITPFMNMQNQTQTHNIHSFEDKLGLDEKDLRKVKD